MKILICDTLPQSIIDQIADIPELDVLEKKPDLLAQQIIEDAQIVVVRSATQLDAKILQASKRLRLIIRAGMGTDNIDIKAATQKGVAVMNTPAKNANAAAELAVALMFACARHLPQAHTVVKSGEWNRKQFMGYELMGKNLALLGLGNVGRAVAKKAIALGMKVSAYDPYISKESMDKLGVVKLSLHEAFAQADVLSLHLSLTDESKDIINKTSLMRLKKGAILINTARGELVNAQDLFEVMRKGHLYSAGLDVFDQEPLPQDSPLRELSNIVLLPHLGASSYEAQAKVGQAVVDQLKVYLEKDMVVNGVNVPAIMPESFLKLGKLLDLSEKMASMLTQTIKEPLRSIHVTFSEALSKEDQKALKASALVGALRPMCQDSINFVNAELQAQKRDMDSSITSYEGERDYKHWLKIELQSSNQRYAIEGALMGKSQLKIVSWNGYALEIEPKGHMLIIENQDQPGNLAAWAAMIGKDQVNIEELSLSSDKKNGNFAVSIVRLDKPMLLGRVKDMLELPMVHKIWSVDLS